MLRSGILKSLLPLILVSSCKGVGDTDIVVRDPSARSSQTVDWPSPGGNSDEKRYSPLSQINTETIAELGFAWEYRIPSRGRVTRGQEASPVVVDGVLYTSTDWSRVVALDARSGRELWFYDPQVPGRYGRAACCDVVNRGVQVWQDRVYVATFDGYLVALDAKTGKVIWKVDTFTDRSPGRMYSITGAPEIANGKVIIGNAGAEFGVRGYISAWDALTGAFAWRFYTVPGDPKKGFEHPEMQQASKTWDPDTRWEFGLGGTVWGYLAYDHELNLLYVGTGNGSSWNRKVRSPGGGDNLFLSSILAINPDTAELVWHYQTTPADTWDYTASQNMILAELEIDGRTRKVLMQAPKNGFFYVLDRKTGELLSAEKYVTVTWAKHVDMKTGRPVETEQADYSQGPKQIYPSAFGGHNWQPMSFHPKTGLVYIPAMDLSMFYAADTSLTQYRPGEYNLGVRDIWPGIDELTEEEVQMASEGQPDVPQEEILLAWDPANQKEAWRISRKGFGNGGVLTTAGALLIHGNDQGQLLIRHAKTGELLKTMEVGTAIMAGAVSYMLDGEQYIAVAAGYGGAWGLSYSDVAVARQRENYGRILAFKLGGSETPLPPRKALQSIPEPPTNIAVSEDSVARGAKLYVRHCSRCHNQPGTEHSGNFPNLGAMPISTHNVFQKILLEGLFEHGGMASYADVLDESDAQDLQQYLIDQQRRAYSVDTH